MFGKSFYPKFVISGLITFILTAANASGAARAPEDLSICEGFKNPIGLYDATPVFSWKLPVKVKVQSAWQLVAASNAKLLPEKADLWNSGKVVSGQSTWVPYAGKVLHSRQEVFWQIKYWDESGRASKWSKPASFELGLLNNSDWQGLWIRNKIKRESLNFKTNKSDAVKGKKFIPEYMRRTFEIEDKIIKARLYVTAKGLYEVYINGDKVGRDFMVPG